MHTSFIKKLIVSAILILPSCSAYSLGLSWFNSFVSVPDEIAVAVVLDSLSNSYTIGQFFGTADFDPGPSVFNMTASGSNRDIYIQKIDSSGNFVWAKRIGSTGTEWANDILKDRSGNIYITGTFSAGPIDMDPGPGTFYLSLSSTYAETFILKLENDGDFVWAKKFSSVNSSSYLDFPRLAMDVSGDIIFAGRFVGSIDFDLGPSTYTLSSPGLFSLSVAKFTPAGNLSWVVSTSSSSYWECVDVTTDLSGNVFVCGNFSGLTDFDPGPGVQNRTPSGTNGYLLKLTGNGAFVWVDVIVGASTYISTITVNTLGEIYAAGVYVDSADFDPGAAVYMLHAVLGNGDGYVLKVDANGVFLWAGSIGGASTDRINSIALDSYENIYAVGTGTGWPTDIDPGPGVYSSPTMGAATTFVFSLTPQGHFRNGATLQSAITVDGKSIAVSQTNSLYIAANLSGYNTIPIYFEPGHVPTTHAFATNGYDASTIKISQTVLPQQPNLTASSLAICANDSVFIYASGSLNAGNYWYLYSGSCGGLLLDSSAIGVFSVSPGSNTTYYIRGQGPNSGNGPCSSITINVTQQSPPTGNTSIYGCQIDSLIVGDLIVNGINIQWYLSPTGGSPIALNTLLVNNTVYYASQNPSGCESLLRLPDTAFVTNTLAPGVNPVQYFCWNDSAAISDLQVSGNNILWYSSATSATPLSTSTIVNNNGTYYASQTVGGCESVTRSAVQVIIIPVIYIYDSLAICHGYPFTFPDGMYLAALNGDTSYTSYLTSSFGCDSIIETHLHDLLFNSTIIQNGGTLQSTIPGASYQWLDCLNGNIPISGATNQFFTPSVNGNYAVSVTLSGCVDTSSCLQFLYLDMDVIQDGSFYIYPNPASSTIQLYSAESNEGFFVSIANLSGEVVGVYPFSQTSTASIDISDYVSGIYFVSVCNNKVVYRLKLIKL